MTGGVTPTAAPSTSWPNGRPHSKWSKPQLTALCAALGLPTAGTNQEQADRLRMYLDSNSGTLSENPRFQSLYTYRSDSHQSSKSKTSGKTSTDKDAEDIAATQGTVSMTGYVFAHGKLIRSNITTDPPPQYNHLQSVPAGVSGPKSNASDDDPSDAESTPSPPSRGTNVAATALVKTPTKGPAIVGELRDMMPILKSLLVCVLETGPYAGNSRVREVYLEVSPTLPLYSRQAMDGSTEYLVRLSDLIPKTVETESPLKDRSGRIYRSGLTEDGRINVGTVTRNGEIRSKGLNFSHVNYIPLKVRLGTECLECTLEWEPDSPLTGRTSDSIIVDASQEGSTNAISVDIVPVQSSTTLSAQSGTASGVTDCSVASTSTSGAELALSVPPVTSAPVILADINTHASSVHPGLAPLTHQVPPTPTGDKRVHTQHMTELQRYLFMLFGVQNAEEELKWPKAHKVVTALSRFKKLQGFIKILDGKGWSKSTGGWKIPLSSFTDIPLSPFIHSCIYLGENRKTTLAGYVFVKSDVEEVLGIKTTTAGEDARLFLTKCKGVTKAEAWRDDPEGEYQSKFSDMSVSDFKAYCEMKKGKKGKILKGKMKGKKEKLKSKEKGKKRRKSPTPDSSSAESSSGSSTESTSGISDSGSESESESEKEKRKSRKRRRSSDNGGSKKKKGKKARYESESLDD
ncbi:hypothetical protein K435DRAFT_879390 [Dendrothele bispora CBS 962.96]|uniref:Uncharacterized protein n=1 Tax=Dendrothele bispora (strain CBS 962.96) TaxID=1314807 RepID=A0A4S8KLI7_DENBC|nr:hypothetical protein K435DRAFT_879390 [Dendrothele bispora CBS 962.96]